MIKKLIISGWAFFMKTELYAKLKFQYRHLKECFTTITPSENNAYYREYGHMGPQYQCMDCSIIFQITQESFFLEAEEGGRGSFHKLPVQCPCGSRSYFLMNLAIPYTNKPLQRAEKVEA